MNGFLCIDKPAGITTFAVVRRMRTVLQVPHAGHAGTLDPAATGVVVVALGTATRLLPYAPLEPKCYEFEIRFGFETDTLDNTGKEIARSDLIPDEQSLRDALCRFTGTLTQVPPKFSAVKIDGQRAYARALRNEQFQTHPRQVQISWLALLDYTLSTGIAHCRVVCSAGTYVRVLAADIGQALGSRAHAAGIRRMCAGRFTVDNAVGIDTPRQQLAQAVVPAYAAFDGLPRPHLDEQQLHECAHGRRIRLNGNQSESAVVAFASDNEPAAVLRPQAAGWYQPVRVFVTSGAVRGGA